MRWPSASLSWPPKTLLTSSDKLWLWMVEGVSLFQLKRTVIKLRINYYFKVIAVTLRNKRIKSSTKCRSSTKCFKVNGSKFFEKKNLILGSKIILGDSPLGQKSQVVIKTSQDDLLSFPFFLMWIFLFFRKKIYFSLMKPEKLAMDTEIK